MESLIGDIESLRGVMSQHGPELMQAMIILVLGLVLIRWIVKFLKQGLARLKINPSWAATVGNIVYVLLVVMIVTFAALRLGAVPQNIIRVLGIITLGVVALMTIFRPYFPSLPFKVGNTINTGGLLGRVEATTFLNTRLKTFDGKTVFVPNSKILNDYLINYHFTPTRRIYLNVNIGYDQDLLKAKQVLETLMVEDARVKKTPRPAVYVLNLTDGWVELGGRCWVENLKYWATRCDLIEKTKLRFDIEGIQFAFPRRQVHLSPVREKFDAFEHEIGEGEI